MKVKTLIKRLQKIAEKYPDAIIGKNNNQPDVMYWNISTIEVVHGVLRVDPDGWSMPYAKERTMIIFD